MKIANVLAISCISAVQSAAIRAITSDTPTTNEVIAFESAESTVGSVVITEELPQWFIEFKNYIDSEETDFDVISFTNKLEPNETEDFLDLLILMIDQEFSADEDTNSL